MLTLVLFPSLHEILIELSKLRNKESLLPPISAFSQTIGQFADTLSSSLQNRTVEGQRKEYDIGGKEGVTKSGFLINDIPEESIWNFIKSEANQRIMCDVWLDLIVRSSHYRQLKSSLKSIVQTYEEIEMFYRNAGEELPCNFHLPPDLNFR